MEHVSEYTQSSVNSRKLFNGLTIRADVALIAVIAVAEIEVFYRGMDWRLGGLMIASVFSMLILFAISKGARHKLVQTLSYLPYLFGLYLFFIEGFFRLTQLLTSFSVEEVVQIIFYFAVGSSMASFGYNATLQIQRLRQGH